jgi:hypothetical protein
VGAELARQEDQALLDLPLPQAARSFGRMHHLQSVVVAAALASLMQKAAAGVVSSGTGSA